MSRIYLVRPRAFDGRTVLVRAHNQAQALRYVASADYTVSVAKQDDLVEILTAGYEVEDATAGTATDEAEA